MERKHDCTGAVEVWSLNLVRTLAVAALLVPIAALAQSGDSVLFIGNSFTFGAGSPVRFYQPDTVTDLNNQGIGGVPALFKSFTEQAGLDYDVYVETQPGSGLEFHLGPSSSPVSGEPIIASSLEYGYARYSWSFCSIRPSRIPGILEIERALPVHHHRVP